MRWICSTPSASTRARSATRTGSELMDYCALSAVPVGRFVLDVHGEDRAHLARVRRLVRGAAGDQPPAGLRRGLSAPRSRLSAARYARGAWRLGRDAGCANGAACACVAPSPSSLAARASSWRSGAALDPADQGRRGSGRRSPPSTRSPAVSRAISRSRDPLSERVHLGKAGFALIGGLGAARFLASAMMRSVRRAAEERVA